MYKRQAYHIVHNIPEEGDPYGAEKVITEQGDFDIIQLSATPQLYFTSLTYTHCLLYTSIDKVTREQRSKAKTANFGIIYGISVFGLAERMNAVSYTHLPFPNEEKRSICWIFP